jgi:outer membrane protein assembly factor BamB/tRNA A-37 threonylcarbamoyl transferase component Bud32
MGSVYRARDLHFPGVVKFVAVKEMINQAPDPAVRQTIVQNFDREANILVTLNHPSIPKIFDYFSINEKSYLILEYIQGKDLEALLLERQELLRDEQVIGWAIELCDVLEYLHNHKPEPIIFRDMKPSNIMVNQNNHIVLVDFGIAKVFRFGQKGTMIGTEGYSPPEQYRGEATQIADIYSLGATLHHLLTHKDPRLEAPFTFAERPVRKYNSQISTELEAIIQKALQYEPNDRFQTATEMKDALIQAGKKTGSLAKYQMFSKPSLSEQAVKPFWSFQCEDEVRGSVNWENGIIYAGAYDNNLYAINAADGKLLWKFPTEGGIVSKPIIHENVVYFGSEDRKFYAVSTRTGKQLWSYQTESQIRSSPKISAGQIFFGSDDNSFYAINIATSRLTWRMDCEGPVRSSPFLAPDFIYFGSESGDFYCLDYRGQSVWHAKVKNGITSSPLVYQGCVYFTSHDSLFYAMDAKSGWSVWKYRMGRGSISSPCNYENNLYIGSADGNIYCIDAISSKELWRFKTDHQVSGSPVFYKEAIYCGSADGNLYSLEYKTGKLRWKFSTKQPITGTPFINNDILYIGSTDHFVYALMT